jgi:hypothetical protein
MNDRDLFYATLRMLAGRRRSARQAARGIDRRRRAGEGSSARCSSRNPEIPGKFRAKRLTRGGGRGYKTTFPPIGTRDGADSWRPRGKGVGCRVASSRC